MRRLSFAIGQPPRTGPADSGAKTHAPLGPSPKVRRRLADAIDEAFRLALARGDIATAEELLAVLQGMRERERIKPHDDRRRDDPVLDRARRELEARKSARYRRY